MPQPDPDSKMEQFHISGLRFLGGHDGPTERELKSRLIGLFWREKEIRRAYLAVVAYEESGGPSVGLCLRTDAPAATVAAKIGQIFYSMFASNQHMDVLFLSDSQEVE